MTMQNSVNVLAFQIMHCSSEVKCMHSVISGLVPGSKWQNYTTGMKE